MNKLFLLLLLILIGCGGNSSDSKVEDTPITVTEKVELDIFISERVNIQNNNIIYSYDLQLKRKDGNTDTISIIVDIDGFMEYFYITNDFSKTYNIFKKRDRITVKAQKFEKPDTEIEETFNF